MGAGQGKEETVKAVAKDKILGLLKEKSKEIEEKLKVKKKKAPKPISKQDT